MWQPARLLWLAELTGVNIRKSIAAADGLGFSKQQLMQAAVKTMQAVAQPVNPDESPEERRQRLLVSKGGANLTAHVLLLCVYWPSCLPAWHCPCAKL